MEPSPITRKKNKAELAYDFFVNVEVTKQRITLTDIHEATGYTLGTIDIYTKKKWYWFLDSSQNTFTVHSLRSFPLEQFLELHRQKVDDPQAKKEEGAPSPPPSFARPEAWLVLLLVGCVFVWWVLTKRVKVSWWEKIRNGEKANLSEKAAHGVWGI